MSNLTLTLADDVLDNARKMAELEHLSIEEFAARALADVISSRAIMEAYVARGKTVTKERFLEILRSAPDVPPMPGDEIEP